MNTTKLPPTAEMYRAFVDRDSSYDGIFFTGVRTTRIFCRPICPARKPNPANVEFFHDAKGAMLAGFRPCLRCRPLEPGGKEPEWIQPLFERLDTRPEERLRDQDLKVMRLDPVR
ncbi:MAG: Ada metal-binding domain-containing protein, partial [Gemmatimonadales bacterium]